MSGSLGALGNADIYSDAARLKTLISHVGYGPTDFFVPALAGWNDPNELLNINPLGIELVDNAGTIVYGHFLVPNNFIASLTVKIIVRPDQSGNIYGKLNAWWASCGEDYTTHSNSPAYEAIAVTGPDVNNCIYSTSLGSAVVGDIVSMTFTRLASNALDTINDTAWCPGFLVEYS